LFVEVKEKGWMYFLCKYAFNPNEFFLNLEKMPKYIEIIRFFANNKIENI